MMNSAKERENLNIILTHLLCMTFYTWTSYLVPHTEPTNIHRHKLKEIKAQPNGFGPIQHKTEILKHPLKLVGECLTHLAWKEI